MTNMNTILYEQGKKLLVSPPKDLINVYHNEGLKGEHSLNILTATRQLLSQRGILKEILKTYYTVSNFLDYCQEVTINEDGKCTFKNISSWKNIKEKLREKRTQYGNLSLIYTNTFTKIICNKPIETKEEKEKSRLLFTANPFLERVLADYLIVPSEVGTLYKRVIFDRETYRLTLLIDMQGKKLFSVNGIRILFTMEEKKEMGLL